jgi:hypothetical protein
MENLLKMYPKECTTMLSPVMITFLDICMKDYEATHNPGQESFKAHTEPPLVICGYENELSFPPPTTNYLSFSVTFLFDL